MNLLKKSLLITSLTLIFSSITMLGVEFSLAKNQANVPMADHLFVEETVQVVEETSVESIQQVKVPTVSATETPTVKLDRQDDPETLSISKISPHQPVEPLKSSKEKPNSAGANQRVQPKPAEEKQETNSQPESGVLSIPKMGLDTEPVYIPNFGDGWNLADLGKDVGLLGGTGRYPLDDKAMVFTGHNIDAWEFGPFFSLEKLMPQDQLTYVYRNQEFTYAVSRLMFVDPTQVDLIDRDNGEQILLLTCSDYSFRSGIFEKRLLVIADLVDVQPISPNLGLSDENPIFEN